MDHDLAAPMTHPDLKRGLLALLAATALVGCHDVAAPTPPPLAVRIIEPQAGVVVGDLDTVRLVGEATAEDIGAVPDDSIWWTLGRAELGRGRVHQGRLPLGADMIRLHARYGRREDSASAAVSVVRAVGRMLWVVALDTNKLDGLSQAPDGTLYATDRRFGEVVAIAPTGEVKWRSQLPVVVQMLQPAIGLDGTLYWGYTYGLGSYGGLLAMAPDGTVKWHFACDAYGPPGSIYYRVLGQPAIGRDGTIYFASEENDGPMYAVNPDGSLKWRSSTRTTETTVLRFTGPVALVGDSLLVSIRRELGSTLSQRLFALATESGTLRWSRPLGVWGASAGPAVGANGTVYIATYGTSGYASLLAFSPAGDTVWSRVAAWQMYAGGPTLWSGRLFLGNALGGVWVYRTAAGDSLRAFGNTTSTRLGNAVTVGRGGVLYTAANDTLFSYTADGVVRYAVPVYHRWDVDFYGTAGGVLLGGDGTVYLRAAQLGVIAFRDTVGPATDADWPTLQGNPQRQGRR
jgi:hypothetical protein